MEKQIRSGLDETTNELLATISLFTPGEFNEVPFEGSWTGGQVAEHLFKSEARLPKVLGSPSKPAERDPFEKTGILASVFLDFNTKLNSPEFILPSTEEKKKEFFLDGFAKNREEIKKVINAIDLSKTITDIPFPQMGELTGWEWLFFLNAHTKRHTRQMKNIFQKLRPEAQEAGKQ
jgi:hypothetical protein